MPQMISREPMMTTAPRWPCVGGFRGGPCLGADRAVGCGFGAFFFHGVSGLRPLACERGAFKSEVFVLKPLAAQGPSNFPPLRDAAVSRWGP